MSATVLGIDVGTSGCRVAAYDQTLTEIASATARYQVARPGPDLAEIDAEQVWAQITGCIRDVTGRLDQSPAALSFAVQGETVLPVSADGRALAPAPISTDLRALAETDAIRAAVGDRQLRAITGQPPHPMFSVGKIAWTRRRPRVWQRTARFHCLGDFLAGRLGAEPAIDYTMAARTMAFDCRARQWSAPVLAAAGIPERLMPAAVPTGTVLGSVRTDVARDLGFSSAPLVVAGAHDQACALWGAGATEPGQAALSLGTSECLAVTVEGWPAGLAETSFPAYPPGDEDRWIALAGIPSGGATLDWLAETCAEPGGTGQLLDAIPADPAQLLMLPHLAGSGTAENDPLSRGAFIGLSHRTSRGELLRAVLEASGFEAARSIAALRPTGVTVGDLRVSGGGTAGLPPVQVRSSAAGLPLGRVPGQATARGAAMVAGVAAGLYSSLPAVAAGIGPVTWVWPDPATERWYQRQRERYALLYPALRPIYHFATREDADEPRGQAH